MVSAVRVITITALLTALNLLTLANQQDSLRALIRTTHDEDEKAMLYLQLSEAQQLDRLDALKEEEKIFQSNKNNSVGIETYLKFGNYFLNQAEPDSALRYFNKALQLSKLLNDRFYSARSNQEIGKLYLSQGNLSEARQYALSAKQVYASMRDTFWLLPQLNFLAEIEIREGNIAKSEKLYRDVIQKGIKTRDADAIANANYGLGQINLERFKYDQSFKYLKAAKEAWKKNGNSTGLAQVITKLGKLYLSIGLDSLANAALNEAQISNTSGNPGVSSEINLYLAQYYRYNKDYDIALESANVAIKAANNSGNLYLFYAGIIEKADIFRLSGNDTGAKILLEGIIGELSKKEFSNLKTKGYEVYSKVLHNSGLDIEASQAAATAYDAAKSNGDLEQLQKNAFMLGQLMNERGQYVSASRFLLQSNQYKDSVIARNENSRLKEMAYQYETGMKTLPKNNEISADEGSVSVLDRAGANSRIQILLFISIGLLIVMIVFFTIFVFKGHRSNKKIRHEQIQGKNQENKNNELEKLAVLNNKIFSVISHDLRSPIISIKDSIDFLRQEGLDEETKQEALVLSEELTEATLNLLDNLLGWAKNQKKKVDPKKEPVRVLDEIEQIAYLYKASISKKEINFNIDCDDEVIALADSELINLALRNLVSNAVKFTPRGGNINITGGNFEDKILVSVKDTGVGISKEDQAKILTPDNFFTKNGTENESGSGIGLKLVNEFVKIMGGELRIESSPGQGSKFLFTLPAYVAKKNPKAQEPFYKHTIN